MKNYLKPLIVALIAVTTFSACSKNDDYAKYVEQQKLEEIRKKEQLALQKPLLAAYAAKNFENAVYDTTYGIWYEVLAPGDNESYKYEYSGSGIKFPYIRISYKGELLNGTEFDATPVDISRVFQLGDLIPAWQIAFLPLKIGENSIGGLTANGLKKGSKIRFATPSIWAYDQSVSAKIPANSPLVFTIEVVDISNNTISITQ
ncbi:FKBP-type peptidyl-prolyl cis-trans isomerase [Sphingobacteriaceae bacterium WQ 2009]|uniref:peptidylprolyl isomerase n=1 Tax=Rhinopithecimicrobium faecis TaxID=2820698 RepID=A0A8T4H8E3_9SPHI|nr:FKBP-type peptidyl-prolyl cis-trans isomerase [Sphingobacteriaceae bacterium WQ 2009]